MSAVSAVGAAAVSMTDLRRNGWLQLRRHIGAARVVCVGESTHGTEQFYALRAELTKALIVEEGFSLVLLECDFPPSIKLSCYVQGVPHETSLPPTTRAALSATEALEGFKARHIPFWPHFPS